LGALAPFARETLKILLISSEFPPDTGFGGIGTYVSHLAPALVARGHRVTVMSRSVVEADDDLTTPEGVRVVRLATRPAPPGFWQGPFHPGRAAVAREHYDRAYTVAWALESVAGLDDNDVIEAPDWAGEAALLRLVTETPYVVKFHTPAKLVFGWNGAGVSGAFVEALHALERVAVENALGFSCPSRWMIPAVEQAFGMPPGHVVSIPNPFLPGRVPSRRPAAERRVLYVGRLEARKGVLEAVAPMVTVMRAMPDVCFRLAGADTDTAPEGGSMRAGLLRRLPADLHHRIHLLGPLDRAGLAAELAAATAVLLPSRNENFPYTCLEAMAAGAAVVASTRGGMAEMIASGRTGLLVDPARSEEVVEALVRVLAQPFFAEQLGRAAAAAVAERYHPAVVAPMVEDHYACVAGSAVAA
jgi:glycosyltransferase involved in cell wall biosynthesis